MPSRSIKELLREIPSPRIEPSKAPDYDPFPVPSPTRVGLAVESMRRHMTDEGWQVFDALQQSGYRLCGYDLPGNLTDTREILRATNPSVVVVQDKREWDTRPGDFREERAKFTNLSSLEEREDIFKLTILKDSQQRPEYHKQSADEIGCHAWIVYYHPTIVSHLAPYVRTNHIVRTYHSLDSSLLPEYSPDLRNGCLLSGAVSNAYPFRSALVRGAGLLPQTSYFPHPGYHRNGSATPSFLRLLCQYKVAICTSSKYGYALRKLVEATAAGCIVITDLPQDEVLPEIDGNLVRVTPDFTPRRLGKIILTLINDYNPERQEFYARRARAWYDYRMVGRRLANDIETLRSNYNGRSSS